MKNRQIFYDKKQKRKKYFRALIALVLIVLVLFGFDIGASISQEKPGISIDTDRYYYDLKNEKILALTFDDGPFPGNTQKILTILEENDVKATFFLSGSNAIKYPGIVKQIQKSGMEIGNHSYTHSYNVHDSISRLKWEINLTNKIIHDITGETPILYRPPYLLNIGNDPIYNPEFSDPQAGWAHELGIVIVGADIDPKDWQSQSALALAADLKSKIKDGHIILLHDGGKEYRLIVEILDQIIKDLKEEGYRFATVSEILGLNQAKNTPLAAGYIVNTANNIKISFLSFFSKYLSLIFTLLIIISILRFSFFLVLFIFGRRLSAKNNYPPYDKPVTAIVPAWNEEENIASTIASLLNSNYPLRHILVLNDGSTDNTKKIVSRLAKKNKKIKLINLENGGKARALNIGAMLSETEIIINMDADTIMERQAIGRLVKNFNNPKLGAVAGKVKPVNQSHLLSAMQSLEYLLGQNIEKKALSYANAISVVPGPIGAWRKSALIAVGGYSKDTLVEDQDLTIALQRQGWKIAYAGDAIAFTEVPENLTSFLKQRFRWIFGTIQVFWKYKSSLLSFRRPNLGFIILPNILLFNILLPLTAPLIDILMIFFLASGSWLKVLVAYNIFTLIDVIYSGLGLIKEKRSFGLIAIIPIQRIVYRQLMYIVLVKCLIKAFEGTQAIWGKFKKTGASAQAFFPESNRLPALKT